MKAPMERDGGRGGCRALADPARGATAGRTGTRVLHDTASGPVAAPALRGGASPTPRALRGVIGRPRGGIQRPAPVASRATTPHARGSSGIGPPTLRNALHGIRTPRAA